MACGISLFSGYPWIALLTWIAFAVVATFVVTLLYARRASPRGSVPSLSELERLSGRLDEISRRLDAVEKNARKT